MSNLSNAELDRLLSQPSDDELDKLLSEGHAEEPTAKPEESRPWYDVTTEGLKKGFVEKLPVAGAMAGGAVGMLGGPATALGGTILGAGLGKSAEQIANRYLYDEFPSRSELYTAPINEMAGAAIGEGVVPAAGEAIKYAGKKVGGGLASVASSFSKIPKKVLNVYAQRADEIAPLGSLQEGTAIQDATDDLRKNAQVSITDFKNDSNQEIRYLLGEKGDKLINVKQIIDIGNDEIKKLDPRIYEHKKQIDNIQSMVGQVKKLLVDKRKFTMKAVDLQNIKEVLQDASQYDELGNVLQKKDFSHSAFSRMASRARKEVGTAIPEIKSINYNLAQLHNINKNINKNLISPEKTAASVMGVGSGENQQAVKQMQKLERITGFPYVKQAENITAASYMNNAPVLPRQQTGATLAPVLLGMEALREAGQENLGAAAAAAGGAMLGSPLAIKTGIDIGRAVAKPIQAIPQSVIDLGGQMTKRALQMGMPPFLIDKEVQNHPGLKPTESAQIRNNLRKGTR